MTGMYRRSVLVFGVLAIAIGFALLFKTANEGGGTVGYTIGALFVALGSGRFYLLRRR